MARALPRLSPVLLAAALAAGLAGAPALAQQELKLAHFMSPRHVMHTDMMVPWADEIARTTANKVVVKIYPASQLGGKPPTQYRLAVDGIADISFGLQGYTSSAFPRTTLVELPDFGVDGVQATERLWAIYAKYLADDYKEVKVLAVWVNDEPVIISKSKPIRRLEDLKGLKVRTPSAMQSRAVAALGGVPVDMPVTEMYNALDRGIVDVLWVPPSVILDFKLMEVGKYYTTGLPPARSPFFLVMNKAKWDSLPPELKAAIDATTGRALSLKATQAYDRRGDEAMAAVRKTAGTEIIALPAAEVERWRTALQPMAEGAIADAEKAGVPAREMLRSAGYLK
jgi:TRAP-type C4-dicarboxylate transport system substrate-binding protein